MSTSSPLMMKKMILKTSKITTRLSSIMMIIMILFVSTCSFLITTTYAQQQQTVVGGDSINVTVITTEVVKLTAKNYIPYALIFLHANSSSGNSAFINITDPNMIDDSDICNNEFDMILNMLYSTYTSALLVETSLTTNILETLDIELVDSDLFKSVAAVVDGISDQNIILVHQDVLVLPTPIISPIDENIISIAPSPTPTNKPSSSLRPSRTNIIVTSSPSSLPSYHPSTMPSTERNIDDGLSVVSTTDSFSDIVGDDVCATLIIEVIVPTSSPITSSPVISPVTSSPIKSSAVTSSPIKVNPEPLPAPSSRPSSKPSSRPSSRPVPRPITAPVPAPLTTGPSTFTGIFTLVRTDRSSSASAASIFLGNYTSGATINISSFVNIGLSINVDFKCCFRQVSMDYTGSTQTFTNWEGGAPYALNGNSGNDYNNVNDLSISGPKRIVVYGYDGSNRIIATLVLNFNIVGGRPARRMLSAPVPSTQCTRRRLLEEVEEEEAVSNHDDNDVRNLKHEDVDDVDDYDYETMSNEHRRLQKICHVHTCNLSRNVIDLFGCRSYCISIGEYRRKQRSLLRREQSQQQQDEHEENHVERKSQSIYDNGLYRKGNRNAIIRGRGDVMAAIFYKYVKQYIPNDHVCQPILSSMTYIIVDLDVL